jgi:hypothetical protein
MSSNWVKTEITNALEREDREKKRMLFPIALSPIESPDTCLISMSILDPSVLLAKSCQFLRC